MARSNNLFILIKSLKKSEKRYFKLNSKLFTSKSNYYLTLFDLIEKQIEYDEEKLNIYFINNNIELDLPSLKVYLYELLLKCLRNYYSETKANQKIQSIISNALILKDRGLDAQAIKLLKRAKKLAKSKNVLHVKNQIEYLINQLIKPEDDSKNLKGKDDDILTKLFDQENKLDLYTKENYRLKDESELQQLEDFISSDDISKNEVVEDQHKYQWFNNKANYFGIVGDFENMAEFSEKALEYLPKKKGGKKPKLFELLEKHTLACIYAMKKAKSKKTIHKLIDLYGHIPNMKSRLINLEVSFALRFKEFDGILNKLNKGPNDYNFKFKSIAALIYCQHYEEALEAIYRIKGAAETKLYSTHNSIFRLFELFTLYKLGEIDEVKKQLPKTYRFMKSHKDRSKTESCFIRSLKLLSKSKNQQQVLAAFYNTIYELQLLSSDRFERDVFLLFDFIDTLKAEAEVIKKRSIQF